MTCSKCSKEMKRDKESNQNTALAKVWICPKCGHKILEETDR